MPHAPDPRHNLRLPPELKKKLAHSAVDNGRSMNAEILERLEKSFSPSPMENIESVFRNLAALDDHDREQASSLLGQLHAILGKR